MINNDKIDNGKGFDWGKTSSDYAKYRDIYPEEFYQKILSLGICKNGQNILDIGTGTGVIPRNMYRFGAKFTGTDIAENQIEQAKILAKNSDMDIDFLSSLLLFHLSILDILHLLQNHCFYLITSTILALAKFLFFRMKLTVSL